VVKEHFQDPTTDDPAWSAVEFAPFKKLKKPVSLSQIKVDKQLQNMQIIKLSRLSVSAVTASEFDRVIALSQEK
jgi:predicted RNA-binding protein with PUA-like domain